MGRTSYGAITVMFMAFCLVLAGCPMIDTDKTTTTTTAGSGSTTTTLAGSATTTTIGGTAAASLASDCFVYYKNSTFTFGIKDGVSNVTASTMTWTVVDYSASTSIATLSSVVDPSTTTALSGTFYFRRGSGGTLDFSTNKSTWTILTSSSAGVNFLFGTKAAKPSSLLGGVESGVKNSSVTYPDGSSDGVVAYSYYDWSGQDRYSYSDSSYNYYSTKVGFASASSQVSDLSSLPAYTYKRLVDLSAYKIYLPDGTVREGGATKPGTPSSLTAGYVYHNRQYYFYTAYSGGYETHSYIVLSWADNSNNELRFNVYMRKDPNVLWAIPSKVNDGTNYMPDTFNSNTTSGQMKVGYYVDWPSGKYYFKLTAVSASGVESDASTPVAITIP